MVRAMLARQAVLLTNAGAMTAGSLFTALLGFVYWWLAARSFSASEVGFAAGAVSIMNLLAQIGEFGMGPLLISELPGHSKTTGAFVSAALVATLVSGLVLGVAFLALAHAASMPLGHVVGSALSDGLFLAGVVITAFTVVLDQAFVGLLRGGFQLLRNACFAIVKLLLLIVAALFVVGPAREEVIFGSWVAGSVLSVVALAAIGRSKRQRIWHAPDLRLLRPIVGRVLSHHALNVSIQAPALILPFIVTVLLSPEVNAAFYAAWTIVNVVLLVPASLSTVVVSIARREPMMLGRRLGFSLMLSGIVALSASLGCLVLSTFVLNLFSPHYGAIAGTSLELLGFGTIGMTVKYHFIAVERIKNRMMSAALVLSIGGALEVAAAVLGARIGGLDGFTRGWLIAVTLEALLLTPTLLALLRTGRTSRPTASPRVPAPRIERSRTHAAIKRVALSTWVALVGVSGADATDVALDAAPQTADTAFVGVRGTQFVVDGKPFRVAGVNNHYLTYGEKDEVLRVLDDAVAMHANVIRTFIQPAIGSLDGSTPTIWNWKSENDSSNLGVHQRYMLSWDPEKRQMAINDGPEGLQRLDFVLDEARRRNLRVIVALLDFWGYTGGAQQMGAWYGGKDKYTFFAKDERTRRDYKTWAAHVINRRNSITGVLYRKDPTIFSWELMNEPDIQPRALLLDWVEDASKFIKSLDSNHLVSTGHSNLVPRFAELAIPSVDFGTWHGYAGYEKLTTAQFSEQIHEFCAIGAGLNKPILLEEFGLKGSEAERSQAYKAWGEALVSDKNCSGWVVWRLVSRQENGQFPVDHDGFDLRNDGGELWGVMAALADQTRGLSN